MNDYEYLRRGITQVRENIERAEKAAGRKPGDVMLLAAVKYADADQINFLCNECGLKDIGENRVQTLLEHWEKLENRENINLHFIGSLQTNKVKYIIDKVCLIHSLDSYSLAKEIDRQAAKHKIRMRCLVEINCGREDSKGGIMPEDVADFCAGLSAYPGIELAGFMTMAPRCEEKSDYLKYFSETYKLVLDIWTKKLHNINGFILSMGMTESYEAAIEAGSTCVRVGRALFGHP